LNEKDRLLSGRGMSDSTLAIKAIKTSKDPNINTLSLNKSNKYCWYRYWIQA